ncbi:hypothetical protein C0995_009635, partial [Termitomyces sp. Mi166
EPPAPCEECRMEESPQPVARAWTLPSPHDLRATTPGMNEAVKLHMDHMHDHLNCLVDDSLGVRFKFPDRVKPRRAEGKHIWTYSRGHKFSQLEDWAMDICYHLAACCYGGDNMDQERIFVLHKFIDGEVQYEELVAFGGDAGHKPSAATAWCYNCGRIGHYAKDCKASKAQVQAAHTAAANSNAESNAEDEQEELVNDEEVPPEVEEPEAEDDAESVHIDGDKYVTVDIYDNKYHTHEDDEEHLFALTEYQGDRRVTLQKAADKLQRPQYTPQEKECLVTYVEVNGHSAWTLWDSGSTMTGITPQFAHVNAIHIHELSEPLMLQLGTVGSRTMVQFGAEVKIKASGHPTKEYVDIVNFDRYDMIV